ncbi:PIN domain-containing protein [Capnocytophaga genosp. AHN8471]|jgi:toxin-antitoxin system, toxin component, PIN family|uniref:Twitching motility protein PilT n=1 Tax=Capnocytophaga endodontalis TaxID=2708117 RepID=A0A1Z4BNK8_9FLAO|nr:MULTISPECIES: PIN domain-containing protein [Capnocytophaga]ASF42823.1 twitching motility protein PilT [Capnocytophaga endodontalis]MBM0656883.1 PIN domain-containing protein [Capnocytophaga genosp. AHN8471]
MNYFLDTNIILILYLKKYKEIESFIQSILTNSQNSFYASTISLLEIVQLYRKKKIIELDYEVFDIGDKLIDSISNNLPTIEILPFEYREARIASRLTFVPNHKDPNDLAIIAHAISEQMPIISCDDKFPEYEPQGITVIHNHRSTK